MAGSVLFQALLAVLFGSFVLFWLGAGISVLKTPFSACHGTWSSIAATALPNYDGAFKCIRSKLSPRIPLGVKVVEQVVLNGFWIANCFRGIRQWFVKLRCYMLGTQINWYDIRFRRPTFWPKTTRREMKSKPVAPWSFDFGPRPYSSTLHNG